MVSRQALHERARRLRAERGTTVGGVAGAVATAFGVTAEEARVAFVALMERELEAAAV